MKKRIIILGSILLTLVVLWSGAWLFVSSQIKTQVDALALADGETAPQLTCATLDIGGYPFNFDVRCAGATLVSGDLMVTVPDLRASVLAYRPNHVLASAAGPAEISDAFTGGRNEVSWTALDASLRIENWRIARLSVEGDGLSWNDTLFGNALISKSGHLEAHLLDMPELHDPATGRAALAAYVSASDVEVPGIELAQTTAEIEAELTGLPDDIRNWGAAPLLEDWQQAGGKLSLVAVRANDGVSDLSATGDLALDEAGYPTGSLAIDSKGVAERIGPFIQEPWRTLVLGVPGEDGRHKNQLSFANGGLSSGLVPISALPSLF
ncbi:DUF2125 domain-containing protein [Devosia rhizoryzae]|uniref:DUF2125 domain-containing protein n=1 Tax=Devosia rhizoryzae TaxID=2774137 RepID=A0ABX7C832_9HYPH|nr:DUF2125 domain-containing protein [Devosia rhizoryzae]QQR39369.1 DUF2125 domain-containing protein [Devosia rhizoryzae]